MADLISDIIGAQAIKQVEELTDKLVALSKLISDLNAQGRSIEINLKSSQSLNETVAKTQEITKNIIQLTQALSDYQGVIKQTEQFVKAYGVGMNAHIQTQLNYKKQLEEVKRELESVKGQLANATKETSSFNQAINSTNSNATQFAKNTTQLTGAISNYQEVIRQTDQALKAYGTDLDSNIRIQLNYKKQLEDVKGQLTTANKELSRYDEVTKSNSGRISQLTDRIVDLTKRHNELKAAIAEGTQLINAQVKANIAEAGSMDQLNAKLGQFRDIFRQLSQEDREGAIGQQLLETVQKLDPTIKSFDASLGNFQRNVGNYTSAFSGNFTAAFNVVKQGLDDLKKKLASTSESDPQFAVLTKQTQALEQLIGSLSGGFKTSREELFKLQEVAKQLGITLGTNNETFLQFVESVGLAKKELQDTQRLVDINASRTRFFDAAVEGANALVGAYGAVQGASSLLGTSTEELQKQMVQLQAVLAIINGLEQISIALQSESKTVQALQIAQLSIYNALKRVELVIDGLSNQATRANTIEQIKNRAAIIASTVATRAQTAAMALYTFVTNGASVATKALRLLLLSTGVGAVVIVIASLVEQMMSLTKETNNAAESIKNLDERLQALDETSSAVEKNIDRDSKIAIAAAKARGASAEELYNIEQKSIEQKLSYIKVSQAQTQELLGQAKTIKDMETLQKRAADERAKQLDLEAELKIKALNRDEEIRKKAEDDAKKAAEQFKQSLEKRKKLLDDFAKSQAKFTISLQVPSDEDIQNAIEDIQKTINRNNGQVVVDAIIKTKMADLEKDLAEVDKRLTDALIGIEKSYSEGLYKSTKQYEEAKTKIVEQYAKQRFDIQVKYFQGLLDITDINSSERADIEKQLQDVTLAYLSDFNDKAKEKTDKRVEQEKEAAKAIQDAYASAAKSTFDIITTLVDASYAKRIEALSAEIKEVESNRDREINAINASTLSQEEKQRRVAEAEAVAQAKSEALQKRQLELRRRQAAFDKAATITQVTLETTLAVIRALNDDSVPYIVRVAQAIAAGIAGAAQIAKAAATPLPQYAEGTDDHPGGPAIIGEKGPELVQEPGRKPWISPDKPTLVDLPKHTKVIPHDVMIAAMSPAFFVDLSAPAETNQYNLDVKALLRGQEKNTDAVKAVEKAIEKQKGHVRYIPTSKWNNNNYKRIA